MSSDPKPPEGFETWFSREFHSGVSDDIRDASRQAWIAGAVDSEQRRAEAAAMIEQVRGENAELRRRADAEVQAKVLLCRDEILKRQAVERERDEANKVREILQERIDGFTANETDFHKTIAAILTENAAAVAEVASWKAHAAKLDAALIAETDENERLAAEVAEWKAAFDLDDHEGDSRLMATAMGQALKESRAEVERLTNLIRTST
ncbi:MAG: hypothetical protein AB7I42_24020 [Bradyrhizobium sp.]|uniref:hypothetical protein n=1 Tax=Bradyrhizobium sp. TaxID=376 RepID=UPI003D0A9F93